MISASQVVSQESLLVQKKKRRFWVPVSIFLVIAITVVAMYLIHSNRETFTIQTPYASSSNPEESQDLPIQVSTGLPVDHETYLQVQELMERTRLSNPEVVENSLRSFDIDDDGDLDVLGFLKLTFPGSPSFPGDSNYLFSTWHRNETGFNYYEDGFSDFRLSDKYDGGLLCSIYDLAIGRATLACTKSDRRYLTTLRYQENKVGYYRDVDAHVVTFDGNEGWSGYISERGGIQFSYPPDIQISEKTHEIYDDLITLITAKRSDQILFEIKTLRQKNRGDGGVINLSEETVFLRLSDGTYLARNYWKGKKFNSQELGIFYERANVCQKNNSGEVFSSTSSDNVNKDRSYVLFTPLTLENELNEIDNIFASIKYIEAPAINDAEAIILPENTISVSDIVELQVPGYVSESNPTEKDPITIEEKDIEVIFIDSPIYEPTNLRLELIPFGLTKERTMIGWEGYDPERGCYYGNNTNPPNRIGENQVCGFGWGDAGVVVEGYYVLDPDRKYILTVIQGREGSFTPYERLYPNLETIIKSIRFTY